ncbi:DUF2871 family protein [Peribacillus alkalitolerans]|uniref:DUF2871 family protein n=1 Tax=Peribacillus alkalitolerans TaxID=1550385 RepID=UPI0013D0185C|nr:DUF2871 family protein [Peribacillus alkalitolerans]
MGVKLIKISCLYFVIGVSLGYYMSIAHNYELAGVHVHINLLGWTALTLAGLIYHTFPNLAKSKLAKWHFWLHNIGLPIMMVALASLILTGNSALTAAIAIGATLTVLGIYVFAYNVWSNLKGE